MKKERIFRINVNFNMEIHDNYLCQLCQTFYIFLSYPHRQNLRMLSKNIEVEIRAQGERKKGSQRVGEDSPKHASSNHVAPQMVVAPPADQHVAKALVRELVVSWNVQDFVLDFSPFLNGEDLPLPCV